MDDKPVGTAMSCQEVFTQLKRLYKRDQTESSRYHNVVSITPISIMKPRCPVWLCLECGTMTNDVLEPFWSTSCMGGL